MRRWVQYPIHVQVQIIELAFALSFSCGSIQQQLVDDLWVFLSQPPEEQRHAHCDPRIFWQEFGETTENFTTC